MTANLCAYHPTTALIAFFSEKKIRQYVMKHSLVKKTGTNSWIFTHI